MNAIGIGLRREALTVAVIDAAGIPQALLLGEGADSLQRRLVTLQYANQTLAGAAALSAALKQPGAALQALSMHGDPLAAVAMLADALPEVYALARNYTGAPAPLVVALDDADAGSADLVWEAAARAQLPLMAVIDRRRALTAYLGWWLPAGLRRCRILCVDGNGAVSRGHFARLTDGRIDVVERQEVDLACVGVLKLALQATLALQLGAGTNEDPALLEHATAQLLLECLAPSASAARWAGTARFVRGREVLFALPDTDTNGLLQALLERLASDSSGSGQPDSTLEPTLLLCPLLGDELRVRLLDLALGQTLFLPRCAEAALAFGAALDLGARSQREEVPLALPGMLGVYAGDRRDPSRQRFVQLLDTGTQLPAEVVRSFYPRSSDANRVVFDLALRGTGAEKALAQILVPMGPHDGPREVRLELRVAAAGDCQYRVTDAAGETLVSGFAGRVGRTEEGT